MNNISKTLYIPLYGKAYVSQKGIILNDKQAEMIWAKEGFVLKGKAKSKWLAYYMGMRSAVIDDYLKMKLDNEKDAIVLHLGCGMDSRILRVGHRNHMWYDVDFQSVITERKRYYSTNEYYQMLGYDIKDESWLKVIDNKSKAIVVMEGLSMYLENAALKQLLQRLSEYFDEVEILMDAYTTIAAKMSKYKNPINEVGVNEVYGFDDPKTLNNQVLSFVKEYEITPDKYINELKGFERYIFKKLFAGKLSHKLYRLYEYRSK